MALHFESVFITESVRILVETVVTYLLKRVNNSWVWYKHCLLYILLG